MTRALKYIFLFLFFTPGQADMPNEQKEEDNSQDYESSLYAASTAEVQSFKISRRAAKSKNAQQTDYKKIKGSGLMLLSTNCGIQYTADTAASVVKSHNQPRISRDLLKYCYRSKSKKTAYPA